MPMRCLWWKRRQIHSDGRDYVLYRYPQRTDMYGHTVYKVLVMDDTQTWTYTQPDSGTITLDAPENGFQSTAACALQRAIPMIPTSRAGLSAVVPHRQQPRTCFGASASEVADRRL
ncbi:MAG: hypothetical protein ACLSFT_03025 [Ruminococcus callidus]